MKKHLSHIGLGTALYILIIFVSFVAGLERSPSPWWDEGWTLAVARHWVEDGFFGMYRLGEPAGAGLTGHLSTTGLVALSFKVFGIGVWQGRLPMVLFMLASLGMLYVLGRLLYGKPQAILAVFLACFAQFATDLNPIILGRQVLGEMPALFALLLGYFFLWMMLEKHLAWGIGAAFAWGFALMTKAQVFPFWLLSVGIIVLVLLYFRRWLEGAAVAVVMLGARWFFNLQIGWIAGLVGSFGAVDPVEDIYSVTALVLDWNIRWMALALLFRFGMLALLGVAFGLWSLWQMYRKGEHISAGSLVQLTLIVLVGSWLAWYGAFGMFWVRYMFVPVFIGSLLAAHLVWHITKGLHFRNLFQEFVTAYRRWRKSRGALVGVFIAAAPWILLEWVLVSFIRTVLIFSTVFSGAHDGLSQTADWLNGQTRIDAVVETYEPELMFLLERPYHYPPDQVSVALVQNNWLQNPSFMMDYDPLEADPAYLVIGRFAREMHLYDTILAAGEFEIVEKFPGYDVYGRKRQ